MTERKLLLVQKKYQILQTLQNLKRLKAMSEKEFNLYIEALDKGLLEAERNMLHEKAARGETCVYQDDNGRIYHVAAKDVIAANPRFQ